MVSELIDRRSLHLHLLNMVLHTSRFMSSLQYVYIDFDTDIQVDSFLPIPYIPPKPQHQQTECQRRSDRGRPKLPHCRSPHSTAHQTQKTPNGRTDKAQGEGPYLHRSSQNDESSLSRLDNLLISECCVNWTWKAGLTKPFTKISSAASAESRIASQMSGNMMVSVYGV